MTLTFRRAANSTTFTTGVTRWTVFDSPVAHANGSVHPAGMIALVTHGGKSLVDARAPQSVSANDPLCGGIGMVGWHHYRDNGEADVWNRGGDMHLRRLASSGFGVRESRCTAEPRSDGTQISAAYEQTLHDGYSDVAKVSHAYKFRERNVMCRVTVELLPAVGFRAWVKEPKVTVGTKAAYEFVDVRTPSRLISTVDLAAMRDAVRGTRQIGHDRRDSLTWRGAGLPTLRVRARGVDAQGRTGAWEGGEGFDRWARDANGQEPMVAEGKRYCRQGAGGTLTRQWEIAKRTNRPEVQAMFHAWEGGSGYPDCLNCALPWPAGRVYRAQLDVALLT